MDSIVICGKTREVDNMRINIADVIYVLDIQNKNKHINKKLEKYGMDKSSLKKIKAALEGGQWRVVG
jgi:ABC-type dipeptide/oligopeptide/nickel transport system ATPase subunit